MARRTRTSAVRRTDQWELDQKTLFRDVYILCLVDAARQEHHTKYDHQQSKNHCSDDIHCVSRRGLAVLIKAETGNYETDDR